MNWTPFTYQGNEYDLSHLHPFEWECIQPAQGDKPERKYTFDVTFSLHTFTKGIDQGTNVNPALHYRDSRETREFDFDRYALSKQLPGIVNSLGQRKCHHTQHGNYFTVDLIGTGNQKQSYEVYFAVSRSGKNRGRMNLSIQSAFERTRQHGSKPKRKKPIRFHVVAYNTLHKKPIKAPK